MYNISNNVFTMVRGDWSTGVAKWRSCNGDRTRVSVRTRFFPGVLLQTMLCRGNGGKATLDEVSRPGSELTTLSAQMRRTPRGSRELTIPGYKCGSGCGVKPCRDRELPSRVCESKRIVRYREDPAVARNSSTTFENCQVIGIEIGA